MPHALTGLSALSGLSISADGPFGEAQTTALWDVKDGIVLSGFGVETWTPRLGTVTDPMHGVGTASPSWAGVGTPVVFSTTAQRLVADTTSGLPTMSQLWGSDEYTMICRATLDNFVDAKDLISSSGGFFMLGPRLTGGLMRVVQCGDPGCAVFDTTTPNEITAGVDVTYTVRVTPISGSIELRINGAAVATSTVPDLPFGGGSDEFAMFNSDSLTGSIRGVFWSSRRETDELTVELEAEMGNL